MESLSETPRRGDWQPCRGGRAITYALSADQFLLHCIAVQAVLDGGSSPQEYPVSQQSKGPCLTLSRVALQEDSGDGMQCKHTTVLLWHCTTQSSKPSFLFASSGQQCMQHDGGRQQQLAYHSLLLLQASGGAHKYTHSSAYFSRMTVEGCCLVLCFEHAPVLQTAAAHRYCTCFAC